MISILVISLFVTTIQSDYQSHNWINTSQQVDTVCNYEVSSDGQSIILPDKFILKDNQRGIAILELEVCKDTIVGWKINLLRIMENDSIVRNYTRFGEETAPKDIEDLFPLFDNYVKTIKLKPVALDYFEPGCKIITFLKLNKN
jgi:hypothetical protein